MHINMVGTWAQPVKTVGLEIFDPEHLGHRHLATGKKLSF